MPKKLYIKVELVGEKGGSGSGNYGHSGRPGKLGGSIPKGAGAVMPGDLPSGGGAIGEAKRAAALAAIPKDLKSVSAKAVRAKVDEAMDTGRDDEERSFAGVSVLLGSGQNAPRKISKITPAHKRQAVVTVMKYLGYNEANGIKAWNVWSQMQ